MKIQTSQELGTLIQSRRKQLKLTQKELAMTCGTGLRFIVDLESGKPTCQVAKILDVLYALGLAVEIVLPGDHDDRGALP